jgi:hypothetical protein
MLFKYLIYVLYMTEDINLMQFLLLMFFWAPNLVHLPWTLLVYEFPLGTSEIFLCFMSAHPIQIVSPAGVQLRQIQLDVIRRQIVILSQIILLHYFKVSLLII